ncbi:cytochrome P450 3A24-like [Parasteatoda tepidariorum]|uniref:cytochrome P450 3A24-like n=1 Tax=Parasteatoda tepidariorum TaxID=114398 RepID=UPI00077FA510|nr:cytochrome P450 3A24-like [Parasteatoda tepidariorum]
MEITDALFTPLGYTLLLAVAVLYFLWRNTKVPTYWKDKGVAYVKPLPLFGSLLEGIKKPMHELELERYNTHGAIYGHYEGASTCLSVADPKILRKILVKDFQFFPDRRALDTGDTITERMVQMLKGEDWKRVRTIITPTFTTGKIKRMMDIFKSCTKVLIKNFNQHAESGTSVNAKKLYGAFSMDVIASAAFSTKIDSHNDPNNKFVQIARDVFQKDVNWRFIFYLLFPRLMKLFKVPVFPPEGVKFFTSVTLEIIKERERTGQKGNDFLQLLIDTAKEQNEELEALDKNDDILRNYEGENNDQVFKNYVGKKNLTFNELVAQCVIFFLAGFETTASTLAFSTYHLALNEEVQEKLIKELDDALIKNDGKMTYEVIQNMKYLDNVISETLRISPPATRLERKANEDYTLDDTGIIIPKGTVITVPVYALHKDPKYFPEPEKFDPDRFTPEEKAKREPFTFMPFGAGPRNCVGMRFALVEVKVCLAYVLSHFRIKRCPETKVPLDYYIGQGLLQPKEITVKLIQRKDSPLIDKIYNP